MNPQTPYERFCSLVATLIANRDSTPSWQTYERLKRDFIRDVPDHTPEQYQRAMALIAKAANV